MTPTTHKYNEIRDINILYLHVVLFPLLYCTVPTCCIVTVICCNCGHRISLHLCTWQINLNLIMYSIYIHISLYVHSSTCISINIGLRLPSCSLALVWNVANCSWNSIFHNPDFTGFHTCTYMLCFMLSWEPTYTMHRVNV